MRKRTSLTLIEVLVSMVLTLGLLAILFQGYVQMEKALLQTERRAHAALELEHRRVWLQNHLRTLLPTAGEPCLRWDGLRLQLRCDHGPDPDPRLSGVVLLTLSTTPAGLSATLTSDPVLWEGAPAQRQWLLWPGIHTIALRCFGAQEDRLPRWVVGEQQWDTPPTHLLLEVQGEQTFHLPVQLLHAEEGGSE